MIIRAKEQIKSLIALKGINLTGLAQMLTQKTGKKYTLDSLSKKLNRGTIPYNEVMMIADILGFKVSYELTEED